MTPVSRRVARAAALLLAVLPAASTEAGDRQIPVRPLREAAPTRLPDPGIDTFLGVVAADSGDGLAVERVVPGSAARTAGLRRGDVLLSFAGRPLRESADLTAALRVHAPGARVTVGVRRNGADSEVRVRLRGRRRPDGIHRESAFRLGVVPLRFADDDAPVARGAALRRLLFERTGTEGAGASLADYYDAQSLGRLRVFGQVFEPVTLRLDRRHYAQQPLGAHGRSPFAEAAKQLEGREDARLLADHDGIAFLYEGAPEKRAGLALWPHRSTVEVGGRRLPYYVHAVGQPKSGAIGVHCHEFAHLLGLPDTYGVGHRTGCGDFCLMGIGHRGGPKTGERSPFSLCAWCRMRLAWLEPVSVDPRTLQRLRLEPVSSGRRETLLIPFTRDARAFLLLENRTRVGFDAELPSSGLLVWRLGCAPTRGQGRYGGYQDLVEAHGIDVFDASLVRTEEIAFPTDRAQSLTPDTTPALWSGVPGSFEVHLSDIRRTGDAIDVTIGPSRAAGQRPPRPISTSEPDADGVVVRRDPITGDEVRFRVR